MINISPSFFTLIFRFHHSEQLEKLTKFSEKMKKFEWYRAVNNINTMQHWTNYLHFNNGIQLAIEANVQLHADIKENYNVMCLMTSHTDQNPVESGFGQIKAMGGSNNEPNALELMQRVSKWTIRRIMEYDPDFDIMSLKEPLDQYIKDFCNSDLYSEYEDENEDEDEDENDSFDYSTVPNNLGGNESNSEEPLFSEDGNFLNFLDLKCLD